MTFEFSLYNEYFSFHLVLTVRCTLWCCFGSSFHLHTIFVVFPRTTKRKLRKKNIKILRMCFYLLIWRDFGHFIFEFNFNGVFNCIDANHLWMYGGRCLYMYHWWRLYALCGGHNNSHQHLNTILRNSINHRLIKWMAFCWSRSNNLLFTLDSLWVLIATMHRMMGFSFVTKRYTRTDPEP